jgi:hypothetical protein
MEEFLAEDGIIICVHRNDLFNLFALNQGTADFFTDNFAREVSTVSSDFVEPILTEHIEGLSTPVRKHVSSALTKYYENPLTIQDTYDAAGLRCLDIGYTYIHPAPPRCEISLTPGLAKDCQLRFEHSWQGMFMGSQFVVVSSRRTST